MSAIQLPPPIPATTGTRNRSCNTIRCSVAPACIGQVSGPAAVRRPLQGSTGSSLTPEPPARSRVALFGLFRTHLHSACLPARTMPPADRHACNRAWLAAARSGGWAARAGRLTSSSRRHRRCSIAKCRRRRRRRLNTTSASRPCRRRTCRRKHRRASRQGGQRAGTAGPAAPVTSLRCRRRASQPWYALEGGA